jgi:hypothetical protein
MQLRWFKFFHRLKLQELWAKRRRKLETKTGDKAGGGGRGRVRTGVSGGLAL